MRPSPPLATSLPPRTRLLGMGSVQSVTTLNGRFGVMVDGVSRNDLADVGFADRIFALWVDHRGLLALRGDDLVGTTPDELMALSEVFGTVDLGQSTGRSAFMVGDSPILRIGNRRNEAGELVASFAKVPQLTSDADIRYDAATRRPVWHTDSVFRREPPIGSVFHCKLAPTSGGETLFADTRGGFDNLEATIRQRLRGYEAVCSFAHHDKKISLYSPGYPTLSPEERAANPANRVPIVLDHPDSGEAALYGLNSSTCAIVPVGTPISDEQMDVFDLDGIEDDSVMILRELLPHLTSPEFTVAWRWQPGDIVIWDNRCTMHAATGYDEHTEQREMWRLTLLERDRAIR